MKTHLLLLSSAILMVCSPAKAQRFGLFMDGSLGAGQNKMSSSIPLHGGAGMGFYFSPGNSPLSFGYRVHGSFYSYVCHHELPFYRNDYVHEVANISNTNSISQNFFFARLEFFQNKFVSPFMEASGGWARYKSKWTAVDPYENQNDNCEGYLDQGTFFKDATAIAGGSAGINFKFNKLKGNTDCFGLWLTFAVDYTVGGYVNYKNAKLNPGHFYYDQGVQYADGARPRSSNTIMPGGCYEDGHTSSDFFTNKHELLQFRIGLSFNFGRCK